MTALQERIGKKCGMTRIFTEDGVGIPVTVIEIQPNRVTQLKTIENDGYMAVQVSTGKANRKRVTKAMAGHYAKANVEPGYMLAEFAVKDAKQLEGIELGSELKVDCFAEGQFVDVTGYTKGKGFAGVIKRHHFNSQDETHGNSVTTRAPGSIGQRQSPGRVFKGKRMAGHLGDEKRTVMTQKVVKIDNERNLIFVKGAIPGAPGAYVVVRKAIKKKSD